MDVAKYIGLFLLKNNFVYIHGLGNLELRKKPAVYNGEALQGGSYDVTITPSGSIDDNLANFIATNEQISISKASNALREFSTASRAELQAGRAVEIPSIGRFTEDRGKVVFIADPNLQYTPPAIPTVRVARRQDDAPYSSTKTVDLPPPNPRRNEPVMTPDDIDDDSSGGISWVKIGLLVAGLLLAATAVYFAMRYMGRKDNAADAPLIQTLPADTMAAVAAAPPIPDSMPMVDSSAGAVIASEGGLLSFDVLLHHYDNLANANKRLKKLQSIGLKVELVTEEDSSAFYVVLPVEKIAPADTSKLMDSLKRYYNPAGVSILQ